MKTKKKYETLQTIIKDLRKVVVAFSGGVDSTFLLKACIDVLGRENVLAFIGKSLTCPAKEIEDAKRLAVHIGSEYLIAETSEMDDPQFIKNNRSRCYFCKSHLFIKAWEIASQKGFLYIVEGSNLDDMDDFRPGRKACAEQNVRSPLLEAELTKAEIRVLSKTLSLPTHDKPAFACLSSRVPYGTAINEVILKSIERAEDYILGLGVRQVRVRYYGDTARVEVLREDFRVILTNSDTITETLSQYGFVHVALDLRGYQTGSMNKSPAQEN